MAAIRVPAVQHWKPAAVWRIADQKDELGILSLEFGIPVPDPRFRGDDDTFAGMTVISRG